MARVCSMTHRCFARSWLGYNQLSGSIPSTIANLVNLRQLYVDLPMAISLGNIEWCTQRCVISSNAGCWITTKSLAPSRQPLVPSRSSRTCTLNYLTQTTASHHILSAGQPSKHPWHGNNHYHHPSASSCSLDWQLEYSHGFFFYSQWFELQSILRNHSIGLVCTHQSQWAVRDSNLMKDAISIRNSSYCITNHSHTNYCSVVIRDLQQNQLQSPLPGFLQTAPAIANVNLQNNLFVRSFATHKHVLLMLTTWRWLQTCPVPTWCDDITGNGQCGPCRMFTWCTPRVPWK